MHSPKVRTSSWHSLAGFSFSGIKDSPDHNYFALNLRALPNVSENAGAAMFGDENTVFPGQE
jgi:hypothetical protein